METAVKWEYLTVALTNDTSRDRVILSNYGNLGWELVSVDNGMAYFKRPDIRAMEIEYSQRMAKKKRPLKPKSENELLYEIDDVPPRKPNIDEGRSSLV